MSARPSPDTSRPTAAPRWAVLSTYRPTQCGIATFARSLVQALSALGTEVDVVRVVDAAERHPVPPVTHELVTGSHGAADAAADVLNGYDVVVVQHEYGIYGGRDGADVLALLSQLTVPVLTVLHTVLAESTPHQHQVMQEVVTASDVLVTMTHTARRRLLDSFAVDPAAVLVIPHGAADSLVRQTRRPQPPRSTSAEVHRPDRRPAGVTGRPVVLTWGLLGQGKGIEWGIEAMARLQDLFPRPVYVVAGQTHPRVLEREGEAYRQLLQARASALGVTGDVVFDNGFLDAERLHRLVRTADVVLLPYDSREQVTSGVLVEAVAAARPVVSTRFPHAVELLDQGAGLLVDQRDPEAIAAALRRVLTEPGLARDLSARSRRIAPSLSWGSVALRYLAAGRVLRPRRRDPIAPIRATVEPAPWAVVA
jgi:glycosyltransferase involved in cell wall biosynthesis